VLHVPATTEPTSLELSPDGSRVVFVASTDGRPKLWLQSLSTTEKSRPLRGTDGASYPSWSPDSRSICFFSNEQLHRLDIDGGVPIPLAVAPVGTGCSWSGDGRILYSSVPDGPVSIVPPPAGNPGGALPSSAQRLGRGQRFPQFLPDARHFLYYEVETRAVTLGLTDSSERRQLFVADAAPKVVPPNELLFVLEGKLYVQTFDPATFALTGTRRELGGDVAVDDRGAAAVSASTAGSVLFRTGSGDRARRLTEVGRDGAIRRVILERETGFLVNLNLSADAKKLVFNKTFTGNTNIVELDLDRGVSTVLTTVAQPEIMPLYLADSRVLFAGPGSRDQGFVVSRMLPGSPPEELQVPPGFPMDARSDGTFLFRQLRIPDPRKTGWDVWVGHVGGKMPPTPLLETEAIERTAQFSPDGNWFAYEARSPGADTFEIFVQSYPPRPGTRKQVSSGGGSQVRWVGNEIFYISRDGFLTSVSAVRSDDGRDLALGAARERLFPLDVESTIEGGIQHTYAVFPDGRRFIVSTYLELPAGALTLLHRPRGGEKR
jgi:Tol biopolymer transport system component